MPNQDDEILESLKNAEVEDAWEQMTFPEFFKAAFLLLAEEARHRFFKIFESLKNAKERFFV